MRKIPRSLQAILWSKEVGKLDPASDANYIIHQVLMYGSLDQIKWLLDFYSPQKIRKVFVASPKNLYDPATFKFVKDIVLDLKTKKLDKNLYVKSSL